MGNVTVSTTGANATLTATRNGATGVSNSFNVVGGAIQYLLLVVHSITVYLNQSLPVTLTAKDTAGLTANFSGGATLTALSTRSTGLGSSTGSVLQTTFSKSRSQHVYIPSEVGAAATIRAIGFVLYGTGTPYHAHELHYPAEAHHAC